MRSDRNDVGPGVAPGPWNAASRPHPASPLVGLLVLVGAGLRLWQYFADASLWIDEIAVAENVVRTPLSRLVTEPLALDQVAPPGFLAALKLSTVVFGSTDLSLRLPSLLCGIASLFLFAALARRTREGWTSLFAVALFALSPSLISHSAEAKPYSTDICAGLAITLLALGLTNAPPTRSRLLLAGLVGAAAVWFSLGAVLTIAGVGGALLLTALRDERPGSIGGLSGVLGLWAASSAAAVAAGFHALTPATRTYMQTFWRPSLPGPLELALVLLACVVLWKTRPNAAPLLIGPAAAALAAAALHQYPFSGRTIQFLIPAALLAAADAAGWAVDGLARLRVPRPLGVAIFAVALAVVTAFRLPVYRSEETKPILAGVASRREPGDALYVYYGAERAVRFYGPRAGIDPSEVTFGACHRGHPREYLRELDRLRKRSRVWVVFAHASPLERQTMSGYLGRIGKRRLRFEAPGAAAELYDLSEAERLRASDAENYPILEGNPDRVEEYGCGHGPIGATPPGWR